MEWLIAICLFFALAMVYLGGWPVDVVGGSALRQVMGLLATMALYVVVWGGLRAALGGMGFAGRVVIPTAVVLFGFPLLAHAGFRVLGIRIRKVSGTH